MQTVSRFESNTMMISDRPCREPLCPTSARSRPEGQRERSFQSNTQNEVQLHHQPKSRLGHRMGSPPSLLLAIFFHQLHSRPMEMEMICPTIADCLEGNRARNQTNALGKAWHISPRIRSCKHPKMRCSFSNGSGVECTSVGTIRRAGAIQMRDSQQTCHVWKHH